MLLIHHSKIARRGQGTNNYAFEYTRFPLKNVKDVEDFDDWLLQEESRRLEFVRFYFLYSTYLNCEKLS